jgi:uncharacterized protein (DUF427 family)
MPKGRARPNGSRGFPRASNRTGMTNPRRVAPGPGQESVWDYPRPPRLERVDVPLRVEHAGRVIVAASGGWRIMETSHPPVYYLAPEAIAAGALRRNERSSFCEFKGTARYWDLVDGERVLVPDAAWSYPRPAPAFQAITDHIAVYAGRVDACYVGTERVAPQAGDFYGGWITSAIVGPFKGAAGTWGW